MEYDQLKRREFIALVGGAAVLLPHAARAAAGSAGDRVLERAVAGGIGHPTLPHFARDLGRRAISKGRMSQLSIAGRKAVMIDCRRWLRNWRRAKLR